MFKNMKKAKPEKKTGAGTQDRSHNDITHALLNLEESAIMSQPIDYQ
jgi:hypothetical protein